MSNSEEPTVVLIKSKQCGHCNKLAAIWDKATENMKKAHHNLRFYVLTLENNSGNFDKNKIPAGLDKYMDWYPMVLLVPGPLWNLAIKEIGNKYISLVDGVHVLNGVWKNGSLEFDNKYDIRNPEAFYDWIMECMKAFENTTSKTVTSTHKPLISKTEYTTSNLVHDKSTTNDRDMKEEKTDNSFLFTTQSSLLDNVCSLRIIERRR